MLRIVTDGAADVPQEWQNEYAIDICPINIQFGEKTYLQYVELDNEGFYKLVDETKKIPKTSQPTPHQFSEFYKKIAQPGDTILSIHVTSKLSGTYASAIAAGRDMAGTYDVIPFDSATGSMAIGYMCRAARILERSGKSTEEIIKHLEIMRDTGRIILALDTLDYARMSGRVGTMQAALASVLNVKPIAILKDGLLLMTEKVRTRKASLERLLTIVKDEFGSKPVMVAILHARDPKAGQELLEQARLKLNVKEIYLVDLSISLAANFGPGTVGIVTFPVE
ncbi:MAG: DegV family protein [Chloroflexi bacterium]|nr:DegV family protein [Chloroflexota bacterium]